MVPSRLFLRVIAMFVVSSASQKAFSHDSCPSVRDSVATPQRCETNRRRIQDIFLSLVVIIYLSTTQDSL